jgi:catechol 2,3-dioxygenase-like lactoylglutathione lyase family enzyme
MGSFPKMHLSLNVRDIARSVAFYEAFFGVPAHKRRPGYANFDLSAPPLKLALQEGGAAATGAGEGSLSHLGIQFASEAEVDAARARLAESGVVTFDEGDTVCCYARQDKVWVHDPDGNAWEVYVLLDEMGDEEDDHFAAGGRKAGEPVCCSEEAPPRATGGVPLAMATGGVSSGRCCS